MLLKEFILFRTHSCTINTRSYSKTIALHSCYMLLAFGTVISNSDLPSLIYNIRLCEQSSVGMVQRLKVNTDINGTSPIILSGVWFEATSSGQIYFERFLRFSITDSVF